MRACCVHCSQDWIPATENFIDFFFCGFAFERARNVRFQCVCTHELRWSCIDHGKRVKNVQHIFVVFHLCVWACVCVCISNGMEKSTQYFMLELKRMRVHFTLLSCLEVAEAPLQAQHNNKIIIITHVYDVRADFSSQVAVWFKFVFAVGQTKTWRQSVEDIALQY